MELPGEYRLVFCFDVEANSLAKAFVKLYTQLHGISFESSDEAFYPSGQTVDVDDVVKARMEALLTEPNEVIRCMNGEQCNSCRAPIDHP